MDGGDRILVAAGLTAAVVVGAFVLWGPGGAPRVRKRRGQIAGLQNLGRTCFLNTLLQALAACPTFIEWLKKYAKADAHNSMITTLYTVIEVVNGTHESARGTPVCPLGVLQSLRAAGWVVPADQQDAHELLHVLLSCIEEETAAMVKKPGCLSDALGLGGARAWSALASPASPPAAPLSLRDEPARPARPASAAPPGEPDLADPDDPPPEPMRLTKGVSRSFCHLSSVGRRWAAAPARAPAYPPTRGTLASRTHCTVCSTKSPIRYDKFDSITLSMANASTGLTGSFSLSGLLRAFTAPEMVKGVRCSKCCPEDASERAYTKHIRTVNFGKLPRCLVLQVARVEWRGGGPSKRGEHVAFPETLCMAPYAAQQRPQPDLVSLMGEGRLRGSLSVLNAAAGAAGDERALFRLLAVVVHVGGPKSGHFATYRRGNGFESKRKCNRKRRAAFAPRAHRRLPDVLLARVVAAAAHAPLRVLAGLGLYSAAQETVIIGFKRQGGAERDRQPTFGQHLPHLLRRRVGGAAGAAVLLPRHHRGRPPRLPGALAAAGRQLVLRAVPAPLRRHAHSQVVVGALAAGVGALGARARAGGGRVARRGAGRGVGAGHGARAARVRRGAAGGRAPGRGRRAGRQPLLFAAHWYYRCPQRPIDDVDAAQDPGAPDVVARVAGQHPARARDAGRHHARAERRVADHRGGRGARAHRRPRHQHRRPLHGRTALLAARTVTRIHATLKFNQISGLYNYLQYLQA